MPTKAGTPLTELSFQQSVSWTDALPVCRDSGVGSSTNQYYRQDGQKQDGHPYEDCSCHIRVEGADDGTPTYLYGVFDGNDGTQAANFALQRMAAEILLDSQLVGKNSDEEVKHVLRQAFMTVEKTYWDSLDDKLAERTSLQFEIPENLTAYEAYQKYPHLVDKLNQLNNELSSGTTAVIAVIHEGKLYVANVGDSRALLCRTDADGVLRVVQLSVDHDLHNEDELLRLHNLGLNTDKLRQGSLVGNTFCTRLIGNYLVKGGYKDMEDVRKAEGEPVTAEPDVHGGITLDASCRFLLLMSDGLYRSLEAATGRPDSVNKEIAQMVVEQLRVQATLTGVAQTVVDKVARIHHDLFMDGGAGGSMPAERDDITLLVRNFNFPMPNAISSPAGAAQVRFNPIVSTVAVEHVATPEHEQMEEANKEGTSGTSTTATTDTSDAYVPPDPTKRIEPYVDFGEFYTNLAAARMAGVGSLPPSLR